MNDDEPSQDDEAEALRQLDEHRSRMQWDVKRPIPIEHAARDLKEKRDTLKSLKSALRRPAGRVEVADTGNVTLTDGDGEMLLVLSPEAASLLSSHLSTAAHLAAEDGDR